MGKKKKREKIKDHLIHLQGAVSPKDILYWITVCSTTIMLIEELAILDYKMVVAFTMGFALCYIVFWKRPGGTAEE